MQGLKTGLRNGDRTLAAYKTVQVCTRPLKNERTIKPGAEQTPKFMINQFNTVLIFFLSYASKFAARTVSSSDFRAS